MDEGAPHTHWVDGRIVDGNEPPPGESPWLRVLAVVVLLLCVDLTLGLVPASVASQDPNPSSSAEIRTSLQRARVAVQAGRRSLLLIGDSVLAGDVMARGGRRGGEKNWRSQRVVDHMRAELSADAEVAIEQVALDGLLPLDALHVLAELDRVDPRAQVELVLELNLRYFSQQYAEQDECTRPELCELGVAAVAGDEAERLGLPGLGTLVHAGLGLAEAGGLARDYLIARTPILRRRAQLERVELDAVSGLAVRHDADVDVDHDTPASAHALGLARVQEHYRSAAIADEHAQVQAMHALLDRLHARHRRATLFLTPLEDEFVRATLPGNGLGHRYARLATLVHEHPAAADGRVQILDLDHPLFESSQFLDHVHLGPEGNRVLALNLLHELGLPMASRPSDVSMIHDEDHDRTLIHRRGVGYADGGALQALLREAQGVAVSRAGDWIVIADTGNHVLRQLRGSMQLLERLAGHPMMAGIIDGPALDGARLTAPHSPEIVGERAYFLDGKTSNRVRELAGGFVRRLIWEGPACPRYDALEAGVIAGRQWLYLLCHDDRILALDVAAMRSVLTADPRAPVLADPEHGATRGYTSIEPTNDGRLLFADGSARIWSMDLRNDGHAHKPERVFDNDGPELLPNEFKRVYPFGFDEMRVHEIVGMEWVDRYGALLIQDQHPLGTVNKRLQREETERIHVRLLDLEREQFLPWVKAIPHSEAFHMWNAKSENLVSYFHFGSMAVAQDDASLVWVERDRSRVFRIADGLLGVEKSGNLHTAWNKIELLNPVGGETTKYVSSHMRPDRFMGTRHEPIPHRGPYVALMVNSSLSAMSDRIGNYSLGRRLELELQAELGYRDNLRVDLFQRTTSAASFSDLAGMLEEFLESNGPPPDVLFFELNDFNNRYLRDSKSEAKRIAVLGRIERIASRYDTLVIFYDNSAIEANDRDGLRATHPQLRELISELAALGFEVLEPSDWLLRELASESPWGSHPWGDWQHHGAPWAIDLTARTLASMSYPLIRAHLLGRAPARERERDPNSFRDQQDGVLLAEAFADEKLDPDALPSIPPAYLQRVYDEGRVRIYVDLAGVDELDRAVESDGDEREAKLGSVALAVLYAVLVEDVYGGLATEASVDLVEFSNYDEYGEGVLDSASSVWSREFDLASLEQFIDAQSTGRGADE
jgi:hypothetical protein